MVLIYIRRLCLVYGLSVHYFFKFGGWTFRRSLRTLNVRTRVIPYLRGRFCLGLAAKTIK